MQEEEKYIVNLPEVEVIGEKPEEVPHVGINKIEHQFQEPQLVTQNVNPATEIQLIAAQITGNEKKVLRLLKEIKKKNASSYQRPNPIISNKVLENNAVSSPRALYFMNKVLKSPFNRKPPVKTANELLASENKNVPTKQEVASILAILENLKQNDPNFYKNIEIARGVFERIPKIKLFVPEIQQASFASSFLRLLPILKRIAALFIGWGALDAGIQLTIKYFTKGTFENAFRDIDWIDVAAAGTVGVITGGVSAWKEFFKAGSRIIIDKGGVLITIELIAVTNDFSFAEKYKSVFNGDKTITKAFFEFILAQSLGKTSDDIKAGLESWIRTQKLPSNWAPMNLFERERVLKLESVFTSATFNNAKETYIAYIKEMIDEMYDLFPFSFKVKIIGKDNLLNTDFLPMPVDNVRIR